MTHLTRIVYSIWLLSALAFGAEKAVPPTFTPPDLELIHPVYYPPDSPEHPNNRAKLEGLTAHVARRAEKPDLWSRKPTVTGVTVLSEWNLLVAPKIKKPLRIKCTAIEEDE